MDILAILKTQQEKAGFDSEMIRLNHVTYQWRGIGILEIVPNTLVNQSNNVDNKTSDINTQGYNNSMKDCYAVIISAGIHGNETAPMEILNDLVADIFSGVISLQVALLVILGNPEAILSNKRYISADINRMFSGKYLDFIVSNETQRAKVLEAVVTDFYNKYAHFQKFHFDMHTAIRSSYYPRFAILPYQTEPHSQILKAFFEQSKLDAVIFHQSSGGTFSQFTLTGFNARSCTLELGKVMPFGQNNLLDFIDIRLSLMNVLTGLFFQRFEHQQEAHLIGQGHLPQYLPHQIEYFKVKISLLKKSKNYFNLYVEDNCPNFSTFEYGTHLLRQLKSDDLPMSDDNFEDYRVTEPTEWILFANPNVALGLRAAILLTKVELSELFKYFK